MTAREREALCRNVVQIRVRFHRTEDLDARIVEIRTAPYEDILHHRVPDVDYKNIHTDVFSEFLIQTPVKESEDRNQRQLLPKRRKLRDHIDEPARKHTLKPLHELHFPIKIENISDNIRHLFFLLYHAFIVFFIIGRIDFSRKSIKALRRHRLIFFIFFCLICTN